MNSILVRLSRALALVAIILGSVMVAAPARAEWFQVSSTNFVIYGDGNERSMRKFSEQLERFHGAMVKVTGRELEPPSPSNRVTIYLVRNMDEVRKLYGGGKASRNVGGFYRPIAGRPMAIVPRVTGEADDIFDPTMAILLHEYAHHFLISTSPFPMPRWASEGAAEFFASASFETNGEVKIGMPNVHRAMELSFAKDVTAADLLDPESYEKRRGKNTSYDAFYGKSWALFHYLTMGKERPGQLNSYFRAIFAGKNSREAGLEAFGDFIVLEKELDAYLRRRRILAFVLKPGTLDPGPIVLRRLSAGAIAMMPVQVQSWSGVNAEQAKQLVVEARRIAARFPGDAAVLAALAEAEFDAENDAEALAAGDAAIKLDPTQVNAYVQRGYALFRMAEKGDDPKAFRSARNAWVDLNTIENNHPLPLIYFYRSYHAQGREPTPLAIQGLTRAAELAPFDLGLRMNVAMQQLRDGKSAEARNNLIPIAYNPHGGGFANIAKQIIERIDKDPNWRGQGAPEASEEAAAEGEPPA